LNIQSLAQWYSVPCLGDLPVYRLYSVFISPPQPAA
jgi:hypothetical protein